MFLKINTGVKQMKVNLFIYSTAFSLRYSFFRNHIPKKMTQNMGTTALKEIQKLFICTSYLTNILSNQLQIAQKARLSTGLCLHYNPRPKRSFTRFIVFSAMVFARSAPSFRTSISS